MAEHFESLPKSFDFSQICLVSRYCLAELLDIFVGTAGAGILNAACLSSKVKKVEMLF